ncbi:MAG: hypothetical protein GY834_07260 [Bacteroidetes bacterium]|nr:hypothetical protein [Bacteroidota bacterium]
MFKQAVKLILVLIVLGISNAVYSQNEPKGELKKGEIAKAEIIKGTHKYKEKCIKETGNRELCECMADAIETRAHPNHVTHTDDGPTFF